MISYWLDQKDSIVKVSRSWDSFALDNNAGSETLEKTVIGKNIFSFILGDPTRMYLQVLLQQPRLLGQPVTRKYRCDSPGLKRYMEMALISETKGLVRVDHILERVEPFASPIAFHPSADPSAEKICRCSICARLKIDSCWVMPEEAILRQLCPNNSSLPVIYMVCPVCEACSTETTT